MSPSVVYEGPSDPADSGTTYRLPVEGEDDLVLPQGIPVEVSDSIAKQLRDEDGHDFDIGAKNQIKDPGAPWPDYDDLNATQVIERINDPEQTTGLAAVEQIRDYEEAHEKRKTVLDAVDHQAEAFSVEGQTE